MRHLPLCRAVAATLAAVLLAGCGASVAGTDGTASTSPAVTASSAAAVTADTSVEDVLDDDITGETRETSYDEGDATALTLSGELNGGPMG